LSAPAARRFSLPLPHLRRLLPYLRAHRRGLAQGIASLLLTTVFSILYAPSHLDLGVGWAVFGLVATTGLTSVMIVAQKAAG